MVKLDLSTDELTRIIRALGFYSAEYPLLDEDEKSNIELRKKLQEIKHG